MPTKEMDARLAKELVDANHRLCKKIEARDAEIELLRSQYACVLAELQEWRKGADPSDLAVTFCPCH